jgi:hypothetical protein
MSIGGASLIPKSLKPKDVANSFASPIGSAPAQQIKNYVSGKGYTTDEKAKQNSDAADQAAVVAAQATSSPTSASGADVLRAQMDLVQQEAMKKSIKKTIFAGDTGGFSPKSYGSAASGTAGAKF